MSGNNNNFQSRLDAILKAKVALHINGAWLEIQIESSDNLEIQSSDNRLTNAALKYTQYKSVFDNEETSYSFVGVSEDGARVNGFRHDGTSNDNGGYGSDPFELTMKDGSHRVITGPWSGRPSVHMANGALPYTEVRVNGTLYGFSKEFIEAIIDRFNLNVNLKLVNKVDSKEVNLIVTPKKGE